MIFVDFDEREGRSLLGESRHLMLAKPSAMHYNTHRNKEAVMLWMK